MTARISFRSANFSKSFRAIVLGTCILFIQTIPALSEGIFEGIVKQGIDQILKQQVQMPQPQPAPAPPAPATGPTHAASTDMVRETQALLTQLGYDTGGVDGLMGRNTAKAIHAFEADRGLSQTGQVNNALLTALRSASGSTGGDSMPVTTTASPSFDCALAGNATEKAICSSSELAQLDRQIAAAYAHARANGGGASLKQQQRHWISERNNCLNDVACIGDTIRMRLAALGALAPTMATSGDAPTTATTGDATTTLAGSDAYDYLLETYIRQHPDLTATEEFLARFAGWKCSSRSYYRKTTLNPFELQAATAEAAERLADLKASTQPDPAPMVETEVTLTVSDYDFDRGGFPIATTAPGTKAILGPGDYCSGVARTQKVFGLSGFPMRFDIFGPAGKAFDAETVTALIGDLKISQQEAQEFYARGFPTIVLNIRGQVTETSAPDSSSAAVAHIIPRQIIVRTQGNSNYSKTLAVYGPDEITLPDMTPALTESGVAGLPELDPAMGTIAYLKEHPELLDDPMVAADLAYWDGERGCTAEGLLGAQRNEFETKRLLDAAPGLARSKLATLAAPGRSRVNFEFRLASYDMETKSFPVGFGSRDPQNPDRFFVSIDRDGARRVGDCVVRGGPIPVDSQYVTFIDNGAVTRIPVDLADAEALVAGNFQPKVTVELTVTNEGFSTEGSPRPSQVTRVTHVAFRDSATGELLYSSEIAPVAPTEKTAWDIATKVDYLSLLLQHLRASPKLASDPGFLGAYLAWTRCGDMRKAEGNPIRIARLQKDAAAELAAELAQPNKGRSLFTIDFDSESLGEYDIDTETFPFTPHGEYRSFFNKTFVAEFPNHCVTSESKGIPDHYKVTLTGADKVISAGLPMDLDRAEAFLERHNGLKDGRERNVRVQVLADVSSLRVAPVSDSNGKSMMSGTAEFVAMRVIDPKSGSVIFETGNSSKKSTAALATPKDKKDGVTSVSTTSEAQPSQVIALLGVALEMNADAAQAALADQFDPTGIAWLQDDTLAAEEGPCLYNSLGDPELSNETGSACALVRFDGDKLVKSVFVRNVIPGPQAGKLISVLEKRFGPAAERVDDPATATIILGWGEVLNVPAAQVDRDDSAGQTLRTLEGRLSEASGVTLLTLRLDAAPKTLSVTKEIPEIKF